MSDHDRYNNYKAWCKKRKQHAASFKTWYEINKKIQEKFSC